MYPCYCDEEAFRTGELASFQGDCKLLGMVCDLENWYVTEEWAAKFRNHLRQLTIQAEGGNPLAQYAVAVILMCGFCHTSEGEFIANYERDILETTRWFTHAARLGVVAAIECLIAVGVGPEADRLRAIYRELEGEVKSGRTFPPGETWRRAYGTAISECPAKSGSWP